MKRATILTVLLGSASGFGKKFEVSDPPAAGKSGLFDWYGESLQDRNPSMVTMHNNSTQICSL